MCSCFLLRVLQIQSYIWVSVYLIPDCISGAYNDECLMCRRYLILIEWHEWINMNEWVNERMHRYLLVAELLLLLQSSPRVTGVACAGGGRTRVCFHLVLQRTRPQWAHTAPFLPASSLFLLGFVSLQFIWQNVAKAFLNESCLICFG